jgi:urease accessory protein
MSRFPLKLGAAAAALVLLSQSPALAHVGFHPQSLADGAAHPFSGLDHVLAMVAVGLWASQLGRPAAWLLPLTFPLVMAFGAALGFAGVTLPWAEIGIVVSVLALGFAIALRFAPSIVLSVALVAAFATVHGYAHGAELPAAAAPLWYGVGFVLATLMLQAIGLGLGSLADRAAGRIALRTAGAAIALTGVGLLIHI